VWCQIAYGGWLSHAKFTVTYARSLTTREISHGQLIVFYTLGTTPVIPPPITDSSVISHTEQPGPTGDGFRTQEHDIFNSVELLRIVPDEFDQILVWRWSTLRIGRDSKDDESQMKNGTTRYLVVQYICFRVTLQELECIATKGYNFRDEESPLKDFIHNRGNFVCYE